jgi:predicted DNA-binding transcriptional regulator YafY
MLIGHCDLRQDIRHFRLSRMTELAVLDKPFALPLGFNLSSYRPLDDRSEHVLIRANPEIADKIAETGHFYFESAEEHKEGLLVRFRVRTPQELLHLILSWGGAVEVLEPESLRNRIREEAKKMLKRY